MILSPDVYNGTGGNENVLRSYAYYRPDWVDLTVIHHNDFSLGALDQNKALEMMKGATLIPIRWPGKNLIHFNKRLPTRLLSGFLFTPLLYLLSRKQKKLIREYADNNHITYLLYNNFSWFLSKRNPVVGMTDIYFVWGYLGALISRLIPFRVIYPRIVAYHLLRKLPWWPSKVGNFFVPNGVDVSKFRPSLRLESRVKLLYVGRLESYKGVLDILDVIKTLDINLELNIVGTGSLDETIKEIAKELPGVNYLGPLEENDLIKIYSESDIFVFPSRGEVYSIVPLEALSSGLYIICGENMRGHYDDLCKQGFLEYCPYNLKALRDSIIRATENIQYIRQRREDAHKYAQENYDLISLTHKFYKGLKEIYYEYRN